MESRIWFVHPFKTGGTSLHNILTTRYNMSDIMPYDYFTQTFEYVSKEELQHKQFEILEKFKFVSGHLRHFSYLDKSVKNEFKFITLMRDPIQRVLSRYYHLKNTPESDYYSASKEQRRLIDYTRELSLYDLLNVNDPLLKWNFENHQVKIILDLPMDNESSKIDLITSLQCISNNYTRVGVLENINDFCLNLSVDFDTTFYCDYKSNIGEYNKKMNKSLLNRIISANRIEISIF